MNKIHVFNAGDGLSLDNVKKMVGIFNSRQAPKPFISQNTTAPIIDLKNQIGVGLVIELELDNNNQLYAHMLLLKRYTKAKLYPIIFPNSAGDLQAILLHKEPYFKDIASIGHQISANNKDHDIHNIPYNANTR